MSQPSALSMARENAVDTLESCLTAVARGRDREPAFLSSIAERYHILAIAVFLETADRSAFAKLLSLAAQTDGHLRALDLSEFPDKRVASRAEPFCDALAAGDLESARTIAKLAPDHHLDGWEYEDDFLRFHFQHQLVLDRDEVSLRRVLERWKKVLDGAASPHLDIANALLAREAVALDEALRSVVSTRREKLDEWRKTPTYHAEVDATDGALLVRGLAVLRLAEMRGMAMPREYEFMPSAARIPLGTPLPPRDSWRQIQNALSFA